MSDLVSKADFNRLPEQYRDRATAIANRVAEIDTLLRPCLPAKVGDIVVRMFRQFREQPGLESSEMAAEYREACRDLCEWALSEAANDFLAGRVSSHTGQYMPTCAEFARHARSIITPFLAERSGLRVEASKLVERARDDQRRHFIEMERQDPSVRQRVQALYSDVVHGLPVRTAVKHRGLDTAAQQRIDALKKPRQFESKLGQTKIARGQ